MGYKLDIYRLVHSNHRSNFYDYNYIMDGAYKFTYKTTVTMAVVSFLTIIVGLLVVIITSITSLQKRVPTGRCQYEATIDDTVSFTELNDKYEVIEQRGKIWILEDKEERRR